MLHRRVSLSPNPPTTRGFLRKFRRSQPTATRYHSALAASPPLLTPAYPLLRQLGRAIIPEWRAHARGRGRGLVTHRQPHRHLGAWEKGNSRCAVCVGACGWCARVSWFLSWLLEPPLGSVVVYLSSCAGVLVCREPRRIRARRYCG